MAAGIIRKFITFSFGTWIGAGIGLITIPILTHFISPDDLGKAAMFALALNVMMIISLFGTDQAFVRFYYEEKVDRLLSKCLIISFSICIVLICLIYFFRVKLSVYLLGVYAPEMILLLAVATVVSILNNYAVQIVRMEQKGVLYSIIQIAIRLLELVFVFVLLIFLKNDYQVVIYSKAITLLVVTLFAMVVIPEIWRKLQYKNLDSVYSIKDIFSYSYPLALTMFLTWAFQSFDKIAIKQWSSVYELGIYTAAFRIALVLQIVQMSFTTYWIPLAYERFLKNDNDAENRVFFSRANGSISAIMLLSGVGLIMCKDLVTYILGSEYISAVNMIPCLVLTPVLLTISESTFLGIGFYKKVKITLLITVVTLASNIIANYFLVPIFNGIGAAVSGGISAIVFFVMRTHFSLRYYYVDFKLVKFYVLLFLVVCYALLSTFRSWDIYNLFGGLFLLITVTLFYQKSIKDIVNRFFMLK